MTRAPIGGGRPLAAVRPAPATEGPRLLSTRARNLGLLAGVFLLFLLPGAGQVPSDGLAGDGAVSQGSRARVAMTVRSGLLQGQVVEPDVSTPMPGLAVILCNEATGQIAQGTTDAEGCFALAGFGPGPCVLQVGTPGVEVRLAAELAGEGRLQIVLSRISTQAVPPGVPAELIPKPLPAVVTRWKGRPVLVADPFPHGTNRASLPRWSRPWVGRTTP